MAKKISSHPPVSVIVTVYNEVHSIEVLLASLEAQTLQPSEVVIVDGGSSDGTVALLKRLQKTIKSYILVVRSEKCSRGAGRNLAIELASSNWIAITDAGCVPRPRWLEQLLKPVMASGASQPQVVAGYYEALPKSALEQAMVPYFLVMPDQVNPNDFLPATRSMLTHKAAWKLVGGFDESLVEAGEDYAFARKLRELGVKMAFAPEAVVAWMPMSSLKTYFVILMKHAQGDARSGYLRPKVVFLFLRYGLGVLLLAFLSGLGWWMLVAGLLVITQGGYVVWAISKNARYAGEGRVWLPLLQYLADGAVMLGTVRGMGSFIQGQQ